MKREYRWIAQDENGRIGMYRFGGDKPHLNNDRVWVNNDFLWTYEVMGAMNPDFENTLIDLEKENYKIVDGILERRPKKVKLTDTQLLDAIVEHKLCVDITYTDAAVSDGTGRLAFNKKGNIRKAIKKWLRENT